MERHLKSLIQDMKLSKVVAGNGQVHFQIEGMANVIIMAKGTMLIDYNMYYLRVK